MRGTNDCPPAETLMDYALNELAPEVQIQLLAHLQACPVCALEMKRLEATFDLALELPGGPVYPESFLGSTPNPVVPARLLKMVEAQVSPPVRLWRWFWARVSVPIPAYQAVLGGAGLMLVLQVALSGAPSGLRGDGVSDSALAPRPPDPGAYPIPVGNGDAAHAPADEPSTPQTADALPSDQYANAW